MLLGDRHGVYAESQYAALSTFPFTGFCFLLNVFKKSLLHVNYFIDNC